MGLAINLILLGVAFITFAISGGFLTNAAVRITGIQEYKDGDQNLESAHKWASRGAVVTWISVALMLGGIIAYIILGSETAEFTAKYVVYGLLFFSLFGTIIVGIFAAITASDINKSGVQDNNLSYRQSIISAVLAIVVFVLLVVLLILTFTYKPKKKDVESKLGISLPSWMEDAGEEAGEFAEV